MGHYSILFLPILYIMEALLRNKRKISIYILSALLCIIAVYIWNVENVGYIQDSTPYMNSNQQGAPISAFDLPVYIMT